MRAVSVLVSIVAWQEVDTIPGMPARIDKGHPDLYSRLVLIFVGVGKSRQRYAVRGRGLYWLEQARYEMMGTSDRSCTFCCAGDLQDKSERRPIWLGDVC